MRTTSTSTSTSTATSLARSAKLNAKSPRAAHHGGTAVSPRWAVDTKAAQAEPFQTVAIPQLLLAPSCQCSLAAPRFERLLHLATTLDRLVHADGSSSSTRSSSCLFAPCRRHQSHRSDVQQGQPEICTSQVARSSSILCQAGWLLARSLAATPRRAASLSSSSHPTPPKDRDENTNMTKSRRARVAWWLSESP